MQWGSPPDAIRKRIHQPHERSRDTIGSVEYFSDVSWSGCGEQRRGGIELMEVILRCIGWPRPVRPPETKGSAIGAQIIALRAVQIAKAHDTGRRLTRQDQRFAFEDGLDRRSQRFVQLGPMLDGMHEGETGVDQYWRGRGAGRAYRAVGSGQRQAGEVLPDQLKR